MISDEALTISDAMLREWAADKTPVLLVSATDKSGFIKPSATTADLCRSLLAAREALRPVKDALQLVGELRVTLSGMPCSCDDDPDTSECDRCVAVNYVEEILGYVRQSHDAARACLPPRSPHEPPQGQEPRQVLRVRPRRV